jgi:predicted transcriptional regulator YheO
MDKLTLIITLSQTAGLLAFFWLYIRGLKKQIRSLNEADKATELATERYRKQLETIDANTGATLKSQQRRIEELEAEVERYEMRCKALSGRRLFQYRDYYPIKLNERREPSLDKAVFVKAIKYFLNEEDNKLAAADLIYLLEDNLGDEEYGDMLNRRESELYRQLIKKYDLENFAAELTKETEEIFKNYVRLVEDIGETLSGVKLEVLIHNIRNPLRSVIAIKNAEQVSGRGLYHCSTRYVYQFVTDYGRNFMRGLSDGSKVSYIKPFTDKTDVKATTTPIFHRRYGLIGIFCLNIDMEGVRKAFADEAERNRFLENYLRIKDPAPVLGTKTPLDNSFETLSRPGSQ